ncbi:MAG: hypothetical protein IRY84_17025 [Thermobispora bispora]|nr:hypothetical protein [Thermobispora bispora]
MPLAERWALDRLRRLGIVDNRLTHTVPEVLFIHRHDRTAAPVAAALLAAYTRGRVNVASAGQAPAHGVDAMAVRVMAGSTRVRPLPSR